MAATDPRLFYSKSFPGSVPAYMQITLDKTGEAEYREAPDDDQPLKFKLTEAETAEVFDLADKLDHFKTSAGIAAEGGVHGQEDFPVRERRREERKSSSTIPRIFRRRRCWDWFERMAESAQHRIDLDRAAKYDKLGVVKALTLLGSAHGPQAAGGAGAVSADAGPHHQERKLHAHGPRAGGGDGRSDPRRQAMKMLAGLWLSASRPVRAGRDDHSDRSRRS